MCDFPEDFEDEFGGEDQMPEYEDGICSDQSDDEDIFDEFEDFAPSEVSGIDIRQTAILGGMVFGLAYEDALDRRDALSRKNKK